MAEQTETKDLHSLSLAYQTYLRHDNEEKNHFEDVCRSYRQYAAFAMSQWANHQYRLHSLPEAQRAILPNGLKRDTAEFNLRASQFKEAAIRNQFCLDCILRHAGTPHSQEVTSMAKSVEDGPISWPILTRSPSCRTVYSFRIGCPLPLAGLVQ